MWPAAREGGGGCVTLGAMFAASRDARPGGGRACRGAARPAGAGSARPGTAWEGARAGRGLLRSGLAVGAGRAEGRGRGGEEGGCRPPRGARSPRARRGAWAGAAWRARSGGGASRAAEVAQPPPLPRPSLKKGRGSRHFSSLKIKLSPPFLSLRSPSGPSRLPASWDAPRSAQASRSGGGDGFAFPPHGGGGARGPCPESGPSVWAGCGSSRQPGRATVRRSAMLAGAHLPPPRKPACGFGPPLPGPAPWFALRPPRWGSARTGGSRALRPPPTPPARLLSGALPFPSPVLKRATSDGRLRPG